MFSDNEKKVLRILLASVNRDYSINSIAKAASLSPNGAFKILKKFEKEGILKPKIIANLKSYKLDFENEKTANILELILTDNLKGRIRFRYDDLKQLKEIVKAGILFGSYISEKEAPKDLDALFLLDKEDFKEYKKRITAVSEVMPAKIHDVLQTPDDFKDNLIKENKLIIEIIKKGMIIWGQKTIVEMIKDAYKN